MWLGGVRVIIPDQEGRILLVCQYHEGKDIWLPPGGSVEDGEFAIEAAAREVLEETGLVVEIDDLIWHIEEVSKRGQRFGVFFLARILGGDLKLGMDPEFDEDNQVLKGVAFKTRDEIKKLPHVYPEYLRDELWEILDARLSKKALPYKIYKTRIEK